MFYALIGVLVIILSFGVYQLYKNNKKQLEVKSESVAIVDEETNQKLVLFEEIDLFELDTVAENSLVEIKDHNVLSKINMMAPDVMKVAKNVKDALKPVEEVYRVNIPAGATLANMKDQNNIFRGFYRGKDGIQGHAELVKIGGEQALTETLSSAMSIASVVVGMYYMEEINSKLESIDTKLNEIQEFQNDEFKSGIMSLISHTQVILNHKEEILNNDELRTINLHKIETLEKSTTEKLGHVNEHLSKYPKKNNIKFQEYSEDAKTIEIWSQYQEILSNILVQLATLKYILHRGEVSREYCNHHIHKYMVKTRKVQDCLFKWYLDSSERFDLDFIKNRRRREDFDAIIHSVPAMFNDDYNYTSVEEETVSLIKRQQHLDSKIQINEDNFYDEDVELIMKDGKVFYLPHIENKEES